MKKETRHHSDILPYLSFIIISIIIVVIFIVFLIKFNIPKFEVTDMNIYVEGDRFKQGDSLFYTINIITSRERLEEYEEGPIGVMQNCFCRKRYSEEFIYRSNQYIQITTSYHQSQRIVIPNSAEPGEYEITCNVKVAPDYTEELTDSIIINVKER